MPKFTTVRSGHRIYDGLHLFRNRRAMWHMIRETVRGNYKMSFLTAALCIFTLAYVVFPFDLIPDYIPVLGWIDDGALLFLLVKRLTRETQRYNRYKAAGRRVR